MRGINATALAFVILGGLCAQSAAAATVTNVRSIELAVHGDVAQHCAMGAIGDVDFGDLTRSNITATMLVPFSCNVPFSLKIQSAHGGLANTLYPQGQGPYAGTLPYTVDVHMPLRRPATSDVERRFRSEDLMAGRAISSGDGIALDNMNLTVALDRPHSEAGLLAGNYTETIVITVAPT